MGVAAFHKQLPLAALRGERVEWNLADPPQRSATRKVSQGLITSSTLSGLPRADKVLTVESGGTAVVIS